jgi:GNAT superfamily N-acetyltransferase
LPQKLVPTKTETAILIKPFQWQDWNGLWQLRAHQLAEDGIIVDTLPGPPDFSIPCDDIDRSDREVDFDRIDQAYLKARGNFWIAWIGDQPVGHIGAQDKGDYVELRRMYVRIEYRRRGIGTLLVRALIKHCLEHKVGIIELWTAEQGPGRFLYEKHGFRKVEIVGEEFDCTTDGNNQIRMRLALKDLGTVC